MCTGTTEHGFLLLFRDFRFPAWEKGAQGQLKLTRALASYTIVTLLLLLAYISLVFYLFIITSPGVH